MLAGRDPVAQVSRFYHQQLTCFRMCLPLQTSKRCLGSQLLKYLGMLCLDQLRSRFGQQVKHRSISHLQLVRL